MPTFATPEPISVVVELGAGDVRIEARDGAETTVEVRPSDPANKADVTGAEQTRVEYANGHLLIKGPSGWRQWVSRRSESIDVVIGLPEGSTVRTDIGVAALHTRGRLGACHCKVGAGDISLDETGAAELRTGAGAISVERVAGKAEIGTGTGALRIGRIDGTATVKNSNGDTWIGEVVGDVRVSAANGKISIERAHEAVVAKTANGDIHLGELANGAADAQTAFGDIEVGIRDDVAVWLDLSTKFGEVRNDLDASRNPAAGDDTVEVHAKTSFGDIAIHRSFTTPVADVR